MFTFNQQNQNVINQYIAETINFGAVKTYQDLSTELQKLLEGIEKAVQADTLDAEVGVDIEAQVKKAVIQTEKPIPDKKGILENLKGAKTLLEGLATAAGLVGAFAKAIEIVEKVL